MLNNAQTVDRLLEAWLQFIDLEDRNNAKVDGKDAKLSDSTKGQYIELRKNNIYLDLSLFSKLKKSSQMDKAVNYHKPWALSFPQIYKVKDGTSKLCPLFSLDISAVLSGNYQSAGWPIRSLPMTPIETNLAEFLQLEKEELNQLVTKEGLQRFLQTTFKGRFDSFETWMKHLSHEDYSITQEPYLFRYQGGQFSTHLTADLENIREDHSRPWLNPNHPAYRYLFGQGSMQKDEPICVLGAFPIQLPTESQQVALRSARSQSLTAVQGPPGSGKTTIILQLVAQQVVARALRLIGPETDDHTLTVVSSTNKKAVHNVVERLSQLTQPSEYFSVPFLQLNGGNKSIIGNSGGAADQLKEALEYLREHEYSAQVYEVAATEIARISADIKAKECDYQCLLQQRQQDEVMAVQLADTIQALQQSLQSVENAQEQLARRKSQLAHFEQLPKETYEKVLSQFKTARMQLPDKKPPVWIRWLVWLLGKTEPQIIAKAMTEACQDAIRRTQTTPFPLLLPTNRQELAQQHQRVEEGLAGLRELCVVSADVQKQSLKKEHLAGELASNEIALTAIRLSLAETIEDFYKTFYHKYEEENKSLFYLARQLLLQEALRQKDKVMESLTDYQKVITSPSIERDANAQRMLPTLKEHVQALS